MNVWVWYNPSPTGRNVGDCAVRAVAKALGVDWETAYTMIAENGYALNDIHSVYNEKSGRFARCFALNEYLSI